MKNELHNPYSELTEPVRRIVKSFIYRLTLDWESIALKKGNHKKRKK